MSVQILGFDRKERPGHVDGIKRAIFVIAHYIYVVRDFVNNLSFTLLDI